MTKLVKFDSLRLFKMITDRRDSSKRWVDAFTVKYLKIPERIT